VRLTQYSDAKEYIKKAAKFGHLQAVEMMKQLKDE